MLTANKLREKYELGFIRIFDAPVEDVWRAWAKPEYFRRWWGPEGFTSHNNKLDFHIGGKLLWNVRSPEGKDYYAAGIYREVVPLKRIVVFLSFADEEGNILPASHYDLYGEWPTVSILTVNFDNMDGKTRMIVRRSGVPEQVKESAVKAWNESLDKLGKSLK